MSVCIPKDIQVIPTALRAFMPSTNRQEQVQALHLHRSYIPLTNG